MGTLQETSWKNRCESNRIGLEYRRLRHRPPLIASITWCEALIVFLLSIVITSDC